jgi:hypothetical protein
MINNDMNTCNRFKTHDARTFSTRSSFRQFLIIHHMRLFPTIGRFEHVGKARLLKLVLRGEGRVAPHGSRPAVGRGQGGAYSCNESTRLQGR